MRRAGVAALALVISGCSSPEPLVGEEAGGSSEQRGAEPDRSTALEGSDAAAVISSIVEMAQTGQGRPGDDGKPAPDSDLTQQRESPPALARVLAAEPGGDPAGWQRSPVVCEDKDATIGSSHVGFAVPADWRLGGRSGGSGMPTGMDFDYTFQPEGLGEVKSSVHSDARDVDGKMQVDGESVVDPPFDCDSTIDDDTARMVFESVGDVPIGDSSAVVFVAYADQAPEHLTRTTYAARVRLADIPELGLDGWQLIPNTSVIEISYKPEKGDISDDTARSIVSSLVMPECSMNNLVAVLEIAHSLDVNGDGHVSDQQDYLAALQAGE